MRRRNRPLVRVGLALLAVVLVAALVLPLAGTAFSTTGAVAATDAESGSTGTVPAADAPAPGPSPSSGELPEAPGSVVLLGTGGLRWEDLSAVATPHLWQLAVEGAVANLVVRSVRSSTCPVDGWLAVAAGRRAADLEAATDGTCRVPAQAGDDGTVPGWSDYLDAAADASYDARPGLLGETLAEHDVAATAVGPGAAIALADPAGQVAGTTAQRPTDPADLGDLTANAAADSDLVVVDLGVVRDRDRPLVPGDDPSFTGPAPEEDADPAEPGDWPLAGQDRTEQVALVDARVGAVLESLGPQDTVLLASLADSGTEPLMQVLALDGAGIEPGTIATRSTRQPAMAQSTDILPTLLDLLGIALPAGLAGSPLLPAADDRAGAARVAELVDTNQHAVVVRGLIAPFFSALILVNLALYAAVTVGFNRRVLDRISAWLDRRRAGMWHRLAAVARTASPRRALRPMRAVAVTVSAIPVASYLANLLPWWRTGAPGLVVLTATVAIAALVAGLALARRWRRYVLAPVGVVAGLTTLVLGIDVVTGAQLQIGALMGIQPQVGGRFYGFNNTTFALWATSTILFATCLAEPLVRRGRRRQAAAVVATVGLVATVLNGLPTIGADFGGPPALIPGFALLALLTLGVRLTWRRVVAVLGTTAVVALSFSVVDWLRPPAERSHLGRFVETVLDGGLLDVVARKAGQNVSNIFGSTLTFLAVGGVALVVVVLSRPLRNAARTQDHAAYGWLTEGASLRRLEADSRMLRPGFIALAVTLGIGFAVNDSGIVIPAIGVSVAVPLLVSVIAGWLLGADREDVTPPAAAPAPAVSSPEG